ncbi:queuosine precursor transporter [Novosphingobium olei]|uniref:Probable queuosine precursor transporter n=1 Tax=Novosphingobium olei TaxID=2728851 RepID=A0A7Y0BS65_9SPHN|nr:queuosine precursor transporter [Novosphingobium olei]NML95335.1 queuosine precursor transporter [Novosphingobium olei]BEU98942.1 queuosine precursor transporter [Novosphingobium olei]
MKDNVSGLAAASPAVASGVPRSLFAFALLYGGLVVLAGVLGTKIASLGHWPLLGDLAVESGIFAFLLLVVLASAVAELFGQDTANRLVRFGFVPLILSMCLLTFVIRVVPPAPFWSDQDAFARLLGQGARMQFAGLISYGTSQTLNVYVFSRLAGGQGNLLMVRAWIASMLSQVVDTLIFITISFWGVADASGQPLPLGAMMEGQIIAKLVLSTVMVPPLIWLFVRLARRLDRAS